MALKNPDKNLTSVPHIQTAGTWYQFGKYRFDPHARVVLQGRERLPLTPKAVETLRVLVENAGSLVSTETLMNEVWPDAFVEEGSLTRNISDLRRALRSRTHIETVSKRGYRFVTPVRRYQVAGADAPWTVGVRPLQPASAHVSLAGLGHAIANALVTKLSAIRGCAAHISGGGGGTSRGELAKVERRRAPDLLVRGTIQRRNRVIRASVEFVSAREASPVWTETLEHSLGGPESLEESISEELAGAVALWFSKRHRKLLAKRYTRNVVAYQRYLTGHFHASKRSEQGLHDAVRCFRESVELDSEYALAYAGLAAAYALLPMLAQCDPRRYMPRARTAALNALEIDETLAEARGALAFVKWHYEWDWSGAEREFRRILTFHPRDALARQWLGLLLAERGHCSDGIEQATFAQRLEPSSPSTRANLATVLLFAGRQERAIGEARQALLLDPDLARAHFVIGLALEREGQLDDAILQFERGLAVAPHGPGLLGSAGHAYGLAGMKREATRILKQLEESPHVGVGSYAKALTCVGMGETNKAVEWLEQALLERDFQLVLLNVDRRLDGLRGDSRFQLISKRMGLFAETSRPG